MYIELPQKSQKGKKNGKKKQNDPFAGISVDADYDAFIRIHRQHGRKRNNLLRFFTVD